MTVSGGPTRRPVVIAGGGTAGHVLPGISIAEALIDGGRTRGEVQWIGSSRGQEATLVPPTGLQLTLLPGRGVQRRLTLANVAALAGLVAAAFRAVLLVGRHRPGVVLSLGGYASAAASIAAVIWRVPLVIAEQNAVPGAANRLVGRFAAAAAVPFEGSTLPRAVVTGNPVRDEIIELRPAEASGLAERRRAAKAALGIPVDRRLIVVFAGSLGSRRINEAIGEYVETVQHVRGLTIHHVVGRRDFESFRRPGAVSDEIDYHAVEYEEHINRWLGAADLAVCRSGGTTVAELAVIGVPSILVPLPIAPGDHQRANAVSLVGAGAAVLVDDADCTGPTMVREIGALLAEAATLPHMAEAAWGLGRPDAATAVARLIEGQSR